MFLKSRLSKYRRVPHSSFPEKSKSCVTSRASLIGHRRDVLFLSRTTPPDASQPRSPFQTERFPETQVPKRQRGFRMQRRASFLPSRRSGGDAGQMRVRPDAWPGRGVVRRDGGGGGERKRDDQTGDGTFDDGIHDTLPVSESARTREHTASPPTSNLRSVQRSTPHFLDKTKTHPLSRIFSLRRKTTRPPIEPIPMRRSTSLRWRSACAPSPPALSFPWTAAP